jgi:hypothetical protein
MPFELIVLLVLHDFVDRCGNEFSKARYHELYYIKDFLLSHSLSATRKKLCGIQIILVAQKQNKKGRRIRHQDNDQLEQGSQHARPSLQ